ncbi:TPA: LysR family transcriptional regulator [Klebsiella pneumoniae]|nr:LysR family transcriptional regulator [Klebsiella pneumoniae]HBS7674968.1 LysR family transcriptional regulator [Klebsiella pneumoniae]
MIDLRQLKYFVVVAEEEHVGRAAERLHISQSPLSRQIAQLEERLGLMLFERNQQRIRLTADGQTFMAETRSLLTHANRLESLGKRLGRGEDGGLCIGYIENAMHSGVLSTALRTLRTSRPDVHIALYSQPPATQIEGLRQRSLDFSLVDMPPSAGEQDLEYTQVLDDQMLLALPQNHPLAAAENLQPAQLADQQWIAVIHNDDAHSRDDFVAACVRAGFNPDIRLEAGEPLTALGLVAAGLGVALIQHSLRHNAPEGVVLREIPWMSYSTQLWAVWHKANQRPLVMHFREVLRGENN